MTIEQTIEVPASHRLTIDVPPEVPTGQAKILYFPVSAGKERMSEAEEMELFRLHADELNAEAMDVLSYQIPIFEEDDL
jgi:hypothetical protein